MTRSVQTRVYHSKRADCLHHSVQMAGVEATWELHTLGTALQIICYQIMVHSLLNKWQFQKDRGNVLVTITA